MSLGFTADPGPGAWLGAELRPIENISVGLEVRGMFPSRVVPGIPLDASKPSGAPAEPAVSSAVLLFVPCFRYWWLMGCGVAQVGFSAAQSPADLTGWPSYGLGPRVGIEIPFAGRFFVRAHGDVVFDLAASSLSLPDANLKWQQPPVSGFAGLGLGVTFR